MELGVEALERLRIEDGKLLIGGAEADCPVVYTGALDELFRGVYGRLPYRSLRFEWRYEETDSFQAYPVVAYPQEAGYTRVTEYRKLPVQSGRGTVCAYEYPLPYREGAALEPYYPVLTEESQAQYARYRALAAAAAQVPVV